MLKWLVAIVLVLAVLSVAGCCCCSGSGYNGYYSTVGQEKSAGAGTTSGTPYDGPSVAGDDANSGQ